MIEGCVGPLMKDVPASGMLPQNPGTSITNIYYTMQGNCFIQKIAYGPYASVHPGPWFVVEPARYPSLLLNGA
jgi:hypothetical protein